MSFCASFQMKWLVLCVLAVVLITVAVADGEIWEEDDHEVLIRSERGAKNRGKLFSALSSNLLLLLAAVICILKSVDVAQKSWVTCLNNISTQCAHTKRNKTPTAASKQLIKTPAIIYI